MKIMGKKLILILILFSLDTFAFDELICESDVQIYGHKSGKLIKLIPSNNVYTSKIEIFNAFQIGLEKLGYVIHFKPWQNFKWSGEKNNGIKLNVKSDNESWINFRILNKKLKIEKSVKCELRYSTIY